MIDFSKYGQMVESADNTAALDAAIADATSLGQTVKLPAGILRLSRPLAPIGAGVCFQGDGNIGPTGQGTHILADYDEPDPERGVFHFDAHHYYRGAGSRVEKITFDKGVGRTGGSALTFLARSAVNRQGWVVLSDVVVSSPHAPYGLWDHALVVDGMDVSTPGSQGLRTFVVRNFVATLCRAPQEYCLFRNVVNLNWQGGFLYQAAGARAGMTITGGGNTPTSGQRSTYVQLHGAMIGGDLLIDHAEDVVVCSVVTGTITIGPDVLRGWIGGLAGGGVLNQGTNVKVVA